MVAKRNQNRRRRDSGSAGRPADGGTGTSVCPGLRCRLFFPPLAGVMRGMVTTGPRCGKFGPAMGTALRRFEELKKAKGPNEKQAGPG